jgi:hypothetical protein
MRFTYLFSLALLAAGILAGCQSDPPTASQGAESDRPGGESRQQAYARELLALKSAIHDQKTLEARHKDLLLKYGYPLPAEEETGNASPVPALGALAKSASTQEQLVKNSVGSNYRTFRTEVTVPSGKKLTVRVSAQGAADPFLVAYYSMGGDAVRFVIVKDDSAISATSGSLSPNGEWVNGVGGKKTVAILVFAALPGGRGKADIRYRIGSGAWATYTGAWVGGTVQYANQDFGLPPAGCVDAPDGSRFAFKPNSGSNSVQLLVYNDYSGDGVMASASSSDTWTQVTTEWLPTGEPFSKNPPGTDYKSNHHFVLASHASTKYGSATISGGYTFNQLDQYDCD